MPTPWSTPAGGAWPTPGCTERASSRPRTSPSPTSPSTSSEPTPSCGSTSAGRRGDELHELAGELGLHELAVEDALGPHQRPKLDHYAHPPVPRRATRCGRRRRRARSTRPRSTRSSATAGWSPCARTSGFSMDAGARSAGTAPPTWPRTASSFLLYGLLDVVVDGYFDAVQAFDEYYDEVSEGIFAEQPLDPCAAAPLVPDAPGAGAVPPPRRAACARPSAR